MPDDAATSARGRAGHESPAGTPPVAFDRLRAIERAEHEADVSRLRRIFLIGVFLWPAYGLLDWVVVNVQHAGSLRYFWSLRLLGTLPVGFGLWRISHSPSLSPRAFRALELSSFSLLVVLLSLMSVRYSGIASPYGSGVSMILVARGVVLASPWRRGLVSIGLPALMYPCTLLAIALFVPELAEQARDAQMRGTFVVNLSLVAGTALLTVYGGHTVWRLRRQVFEARAIGKYELRRCIGRGGMGEVWAAYHAGLRREVALKLLRPLGDINPAAVARFEREVKATSELTHPNTVRVFDCGTTEDGVWFYAMELLEGVDLRTLVEREGPLAGGRAAHLVWQASRALAEAHAHGIVHRDLKPANLFVTSPGGEADFLKLLDFGVAKGVHEDTDLTQAGCVAGTPSYMSPETARGLRADERSDVYALGAVLYFALLGRPPFVGASAPELLYAHVHTAPSPPSALGLAIPEDLEAVVLRCLEKDPERRFASAVELAAALGRCISRMGAQGDVRYTGGALPEMGSPGTERVGSPAAAATLTRTQIS
jgi:serine/threonine-protein kinase